MSFTLAPNAPPAPLTGKVEGDEVVARQGRDGPGFVRFGPYVGLKGGGYLATYSLAAEGVRPDEAVAILQAVGGNETIFASKAVTGRQAPPLPTLNDVDLPFATPGGHFVETRLYYRGRGTLRAGPINVQPIAAPQPVSHFHDWPLAFLWVAGTVLVGWLFAQVMLLSRRRET